jgi:hypothetical protein
MAKRERAKLEREQAARSAARVAVFAKLWEDPAYVALNERKDRLNHAVTLAELYRPETVELCMARFRRLHRKIQKIEAAALHAAGLTP